MTYTVQRTSRFRRDYKRAIKRGYDMGKLRAVVAMLANGETLPVETHPHPLEGEYSGYNECHVEPNWLLVYKHVERVSTLMLYRTGTHSDLFKGKG